MEREQILELRNTAFPTWLDSKSRTYCRMANDVLQFDPNRCGNCPLWAGDCRSVYCMYFGVRLADNVKTNRIKKFTDGMIAAGLTKEFPCFVEKNWNKFAGMRKPDNWTEEDYLRIEEAYQFAAKAHKGQKRKGSKIPYIVHPVEASIIAYTLIVENEAHNVDVVVATILHDVVEDTKYSIDDIYHRFGNEVARLVDSVTENKREGISKSQTWRVRKEEAVARARHASIDTKVIILADKLSNLRATSTFYKKEGEKFWERFNQKDKRQHEWYYRSMAEVLIELQETSQYKEYLELCNEVFGKLD